MLPNLIEFGIFLDFKINQDFIARVLCINKENEASKCNGKCYLAAQLKKVEEEEKKQAPLKKEEKLASTSLFFQSSFVFKFTSLFISKMKTTFENECYQFVFISDIFRPPKTQLNFI